MKLASLFALSLVLLASVAALGQSFPKVVAQDSVLDQSENIEGRTLLTPTKSGVYRVSVYLAGGATEPAGKWKARVHWTDEKGGRSTPRDWAILAKSQLVSATQIIRAIAGRPIVYFVGRTDSADFTYNLFITVEQLESDR
jgi:hypothetical protein